MPAPHPPEFRKRAVELARDRAKPIKQLAADLQISESCLRNGMAQADVDEGKREGLEHRGAGRAHAAAPREPGAQDGA
jgi:transposase